MPKHESNAAPARPQADPAPTEAPAWFRPAVEQLLREFAAKSATGPRFVEFKELLQLVPLGERTIRDAMRKGWIPHIRLPGARRILFDPELVRASLARYSTGGLQ